MNEVHDVPLSRSCCTKKIVDLCFDFIWLLSFFLLPKNFFRRKTNVHLELFVRARGEKTLQAIFTVSGGGGSSITFHWQQISLKISEIWRFSSPHTRHVFSSSKGKGTLPNWASNKIMVNSQTYTYSLGRSDRRQTIKNVNFFFRISANGIVGSVE